MALKINTAEGGTDNAGATGTVTTTNSATSLNGDGFLSVSAGSGGTLTYDTAQAMHGTHSFNLTPGGTQGCSFTFQDASTSPNFTASMYVYLTGAPSAETILMQIQTSGGVNVARLHLNTSRQLRTVNQAGTAIATFTNAIALNTWTRINLWGTVNATTGTINAAMYTGDSLTAIETKNHTSQNTGSTDAARAAYGKLTGALTMATLYIDDPRVNIGSATELGLPIVNGSVTAVRAQATAAANAPTVTASANASVSAVRATATAAAGIPAIGDGSGVPVFRATTGALGGSTVTSLTLTIPGTVVADDMGIIVSLVGGATGAASAPAGWSTLVNDQVTTTGSGRISIFYRRYVAGDANPTVNWPSAPASGNNNALLAVWYSGVGTPTVGAFSLSSTASTTWTAPAITTGSGNHMVLAISGERGSGSGWPSIATWSPDATMRASRYATGNFYPAIVIGDIPMSLAGTTNAQTATWNFSTNSAFAVQLDLPPTAVGASVSSVTATANAAGLPPGAGSNGRVFAVTASASSLAPVPAILAATAQTGGGPMTASALMRPPGVRQRIFVFTRATATAAGIAPSPPSSSNFAVVMVATALVRPPAVIGNASVSAVAGTATAAAQAPGGGVKHFPPAALATSAGFGPRLGPGPSVTRPPTATASAAMAAPVVGGFLTATHAVATALILPPLVSGRSFVLAPRATAAANGFTPDVGHAEWVFRPPTVLLHYDQENPLMKRIGYPTGTSVLLIDGFYQNVEYPDDEMIAAASAVYIGGHDYILSPDELVALTSAGYGDYINQEVFV